jgi:Leucine-rich repeat (LRR) protein
MIIEIDFGIGSNVTSCISTLTDIVMHDKVVSVDGSVQTNFQSGGNLMVNFGSTPIDTFDEMPNLPIVKVLNFNNNNLTNIDNIINCPLVEYIYLQNNNLDTLPLCLLQMEHIKEIHLDNNPLNNIPIELNEWLQHKRIN